MEDLQEDHKLDPKSMHELQQFVQQESDKAKLRGGKVPSPPPPVTSPTTPYPPPITTKVQKKKKRL